MMRAIQLAVACVAVLVASAGQVHAGLILQPTAVTAPSENGTALAVNMVNQSGLSVGYTSQVTDFDSFLASATHSNSGSTVWANVAPVAFPVNLDFDLGGSFTLESLGLWNWDTGTGGVALRDFNLFAANDSSFSSATLLGSFTALPSASNSAATGQVFSFAPTTASFMRLELLSNYGSTSQIVVSEVAFETSSSVAAVPEPSSLALFGIGACVAAGSAALRRRRDKQAATA